MHGLRFAHRPGTVDEIVLSEAYQQLRSTPMELRRDQGDVLVDVGAHIGSFTVIVAAVMPHATVHAIEPARANFDLLSANITANVLQNVISHRIALSDRDGEIALHHAEENWGHSILPVMAAGPDSSEPVPSQTLASFMAENGLDLINFIKMNAEGAEYPVLLEASPAVLRRVRSMAVEFHSVPGHDGERIRERLAECGFRADIAYSAEEAGKGWIWASLSGADSPRSMRVP